MGAVEYTELRQYITAAVSRIERRLLSHKRSSTVYQFPPFPAPLQSTVRTAQYVRSTTAEGTGEKRYTARWTITVCAFDGATSHRMCALHSYTELYVHSLAVMILAQQQQIYHSFAESYHGI